MRVLLLDHEPAPQLLAAAGGDAAALFRRPPSLAHLPRLLDELRAAAVVLGPSFADGPHAVAAVTALRRHRPAVPVVAVSRGASAAAAVALLEAGLTKWIPLADAGAALAELRTRLDAAPAHDEPTAVRTGLVGESPAMRAVRAQVRTAAETNAHVLVEGETGTGKEVVARAIHALGRRGTRPFVPVNCAAVPEALAESEFFGHARGAFTGALHEHPGAIRLAEGGTLFLDEIEDLPLALQAKLLRVLQDREVRPVGGSIARRIDVRVVAASNRELARMVDEGRFRRDLFYRLRVLAIVLPPLRERRGDVPALVAHFVGAFNARAGTGFAQPSPTALRALCEHSWPGNVRELENLLEALCIQAQARHVDLDRVLREHGTPAGDDFWADERARILRTLDANRWNRARAAAALGISRVTLWRRMGRHGIRDPLAPAGGGETS